eukprot:NODE_877_length_1270_cov_52.538084_g647_i0.p1 GENE.NODE_877_length_1270_cov_52.538084_g647_i0~~NODE_877_length_1270_cov_52.538084_g647_i0.p1  ORF type:complete len:305 (+),score=39.07 NODE_877_length_1270_cov_52.538084_g647_i0:125-1039(+)
MESFGLKCLEDKNYETALWFFEKKLQLDPTNEALQQMIRDTKAKVDPGSVPRSQVQEELLSHIISKKPGDFYGILSLDKSADSATIAKTYKNVALLIHPDKNPSPQALDAFKRAKRAFDVLSHPKKRDVYDKFGEEGLLTGESLAASHHLSPAEASRVRRASTLRRPSIVVPEELLPESPKPLDRSSSGRFGSVRYESPQSLRNQAEQWSHQFQARKMKMSPTTRTAHSSRKLYEPPRSLQRDWARQEIENRLHGERLGELARSKQKNLDKEYDKLLLSLNKQRNACTLASLAKSPPLAPDQQS